MNIEELHKAADRLSKRRPPFKARRHFVDNALGAPKAAFSPDPVGECMAADFALAANALPRLLAEKAAVQDVLNESSAWVPDGGHPDAKVREGVLAGFGMALARMRGAITEALARP